MVPSFARERIANGREPFAPGQKSEAMSWHDSIGKSPLSEYDRSLYQSQSVIVTRNISHISHNISNNMSDNEGVGFIHAQAMNQ